METTKRLGASAYYWLWPDARSDARAHEQPYADDKQSPTSSDVDSLLDAELARSDSAATYATGVELASMPSAATEAPLARQVDSWLGDTLSRHANKRMRRLVGQSWLTNRFGEPSLEEAFLRYYTHHQLKYVRRMFIGVAILLFGVVIALACLNTFETDGRGAGGTLEGGIAQSLLTDPFAVQTNAAAGCLFVGASLLMRRLPRHWWLLASFVWVAAYQLELWATVRACQHALASARLEAERDHMSQSVPAIEHVISMMFHAYRLLYFVGFVSAVCLLSCLDYVYSATVSIAMWASFAMAEIHLLLQLPHDDAELELELRIAAGAHVVDAVILAPVAVTLLLYGARRINRFERQIFLTTVALQGDGDVKRDLIAGKHTVLLALFSNPTVPSKLRKALRLEPLRFGQEMRFLLRSVPKVFLALLPAATLADARAALEAHAPRILMFSGHTLLGALAFEKDDGRIDHHRLEQRNAEFVDVLRRAALPMEPWAQMAASGLSTLSATPPQSALECVFLNSCESAKLGRAIAHDLERDIVVVCWATLTEDSAAREFAQGFYDVIGDTLKHENGVPRRMPIEAAFRRACGRFKEAGFRFGDPADYLHQDSNHPHHAHPDLHNCDGCNPPVHGSVVLLVRRSGVVYEYDGDSGPEEFALASKIGVGDDPGRSFVSQLLSRDADLAPSRIGHDASWCFRGRGAWMAQTALILLAAVAMAAAALFVVEYEFGEGPLDRVTRA